MSTIIFDNFEDLLETKTKVAQELLKTYGEGEWQNNEIYYYSDIEDFTEYELTEGVYADLGLEDFKPNGAPYIMAYINLEALGAALVSSWDDSSNFEASTGEIVTTSYGW